MKILTLLLLCIFAYTQTVIAQQSAAFATPEPTHIFCKHGVEHLLAQSASDIPLVKRPYDVLSMNIFMDWRTPLSAVDSIPSSLRTYKGITSMTIANTVSPLSSVTIDVGTLRIDSVFINGVYYNQNLPAKVFQEQSIPIPSPFPVNQPYTLTFHYTYVSPFNQGFFMYEKNRVVQMGGGIRDTLPAALCYTMSEPINARDWTPCNDAPYDKYKCAISIRVPEGNVATSNGNQDSIRTHSEDNSLTFFYSDTTPIPTYLMIGVASKFAYWNDVYSRVTDTTKKVPVHYYAWERDVEGNNGRYNAKNAYKFMIPMMEEYSNIFGEYPYNSYGMAVIQPFQYGGMEHQTMSTINRVWLVEDRYEDGIAHELMHHWTGNLITCATWNDLWINEGGATWGEAVWREAKTKDIVDAELKMTGAKVYYLSQKQVVAPIYGIPIDKLFQYTWITYSKASWIYHMMDRHYGRDLFRNALRKFFARYSYQSVTTEEFRTFFHNELTPNDDVSNVPIPLTVNEFFDQWVYGAGHPTFTVNFKNKPVGENTEVTLTLRQTQQGEGIASAFKAPVEVLFYKVVNDSIVAEQTVRLYMSDRGHMETFTLPFEPTDAYVDPNTSLLHEVSEITTSVAEQAPKGLEIDAYFENNLLQIRNINEGKLSIEIYTVNGERISTTSTNVLSGNYSSTITNKELSNGYYLIVIRNNAQTTSIPLVIAK
jgi:aminopeptidase N